MAAVVSRGQEGAGPGVGGACAGGWDGRDGAWFAGWSAAAGDTLWDGVSEESRVGAEQVGA